MPHPPASAPLAPVTTPPMSEGPIRSCWAPTSLGHAAKNAATLTANNLSYIVRIALMQASLITLSIGHLLHDLTAGHGHVGGDVADRRFRHSERIGAQSRAVSEHRRLERTLLVAIDGQIGAVRSRAAQRL